MNSSFPVATLFVRATNTSVGAFFMVILIVAEFGCLANTIVALGNLMWAMARDGALPNHKFWYKLEGFGDNKVPIRIYTLQVVICIVLIMPVSIQSKLHPLTQMIDIIYYYRHLVVKSTGPLS